ncbi:MAG: ATP-dependent Clp protease adaptor ClpS [Deltaproteobacteria bacterium]|nr:ATP-dependent Clp protease adaptor ClpS [Deltaproteobacteria bacterium]
MSTPKTSTPAGDVATKDRAEVRKPRKHKVLLHNDDFTTMQFVVHVLQKFFKKSETEAMQIMFTVHHTGMGVAGVYPAEVAEAKVVQVTDYAQANQYPLKVTSEPE